MKSSETKVASSSHQSHQNDAQSPFFKKAGEGTFFSEGATDMVSPKRAEPFFSPSSIQPKLTIGQPNDKYEKEADATADRVVQQISNSKSETSSTNNPINNNTSTIQTKPVEESLQAKEKEGEEISMKEMDVQRKPIFESAEDPSNDNDIQRQASDTSAPTPSADFQSQLDSSKGGGSPMSSGTQSSMESAFGNDFSDVKIHNDSNASDMSQSIGAQAFTHGSDIYFNEGKYDEGSTEGNRLLAHELTHTVQQGGGVNRLIQKTGDSNEIDEPKKEPPYKVGKIELNPNPNSKDKKPKLVLPTISIPRFRIRNLSLIHI